MGGALYHLHTDHLGSATLTTDTGGNRVGELRYIPYGVTRYQWGSTPTDRLYTGQRWDSGIGLYDYRARYYHSVLGRFIRADPLVPEPGNPQDLNRFAYVRSNPLGYIDPTGHFSKEELLKYGVFYGPKQMAGCREDEFGYAAWYWTLRAAEEGDWLKAWFSFRSKGRSGGMTEERGQFQAAQGMLLLVLESGASYRVYYGGLRGIENPDIYVHLSRIVLEKSGTQLWGVESLRRYVQGTRSVLQAVTDPDFYEVNLGWYHGVGGHIAAKGDRFGRFYLGLSVGLGIGRGAVSVTQGNLWQDYVPDPGQVHRAIGGWGVNLQGGYLIGGGVSFPDIGPISVQYGFSLPGLVFSLSYSWQVWPRR